MRAATSRRAALLLLLVAGCKGAPPATDAAPDLSAAAFPANCTVATCQGGLDYYDPSIKSAIPRTPERFRCLPGDPACDRDEAWLSGPVSGSDAEDLALLFVPERRADLRAYLARPDNAGVLILVGGWGEQAVAGGWGLAVADWANLELLMPVIQLGYYGPCLPCATEYSPSHADGVAHGKLLHEKLRRAGATRVLWAGHSAGSDVVQELAAWGHARSDFDFACAFATPNVPPLARSLAVPPTGPDPQNPNGGLFLLRAYQTHQGTVTDYGGKLLVFNRASDCAVKGGSFLDCINLSTHDYSGVLRSTSFRAALSTIRAGRYAFVEPINGSAAQGEADRQAGRTYDCLEGCP